MTDIILAVGDICAGRCLRDALASMGHQVTLTSSASEMLKTVSQYPPALLVVDDELPLVRGLDLVGRIRADRMLDEVILLTVDPDVLSLTTRVGIERLHCMMKPTDLEQLRQTVACLLGQDTSERAKSDDRLGQLEEENARFRERLAELEGRLSSRSDSRLRSQASAPVVESSAGLKVLVVDDDPQVRRALARGLSGHRVEVAENGRDAARMLERSRPDVIVTDLAMPEMGGLELAERVRESWPQLAERIVFVSGSPAESQRVEACSPRAPFLPKPVDAATLQERIADVVASALPGRSGNRPVNNSTIAPVHVDAKRHWRG